MSKTMTLSFKYSLFKLTVGHTLLNDLGTFAVFCLFAIYKGVSIKKLSDIVQLSPDVLEKQLSFLVKRGYLDRKLTIKSSGINVVKIYMYINKINKVSPTIALEHYIGNIENKKVFFNVTDTFDEKAEGTVVTEKYWTWKVKEQFTKIASDKQNELIEGLKKVYPSNEHQFEKYTQNGEFIFDIVDLKKEVYRNINISPTILLQRLIPLTEDTDIYESVIFSVPTITFQKKFKLLTGKKNSSITSFKNMKETYTFNLFDGKLFDEVYFEQKLDHTFVTELPPQISDDQIDIETDEICFPPNLFLFTNVETKIWRDNIQVVLKSDSLLSMISGDDMKKGNCL